MRHLVLYVFLIVTTTISGQNVASNRANTGTMIASVAVDRVARGSGGAATALWVRPYAAGTVVVGATFQSLRDARWSYATAAVTRQVNPRTFASAEVNLGGSVQADERTRYILVRGGVTRELLARKLFGEVEWLQADVRRQQDAIARFGFTWLPGPSVAVRPSVYQSLFGDTRTTLVSVRVDKALGQLSLIAGYSAGSAAPLLLQETGDAAAEIREAYGGLSFDAASLRWTVVISTIAVRREERERFTISCAIPLRRGRAAPQ